MNVRHPDRNIINNVIKKNLKKKETIQISLKLDKELHSAILILSDSLNISKNKLIEDILYESGIIQEIDENYLEVHDEE